MITYILSMTFIGMVIIGLICFIIYYIMAENTLVQRDKKPRNVTLVVGTTLTILFILINLWYVNNTESGARMIKDFQSDTNGGISRSVKVYSMTGEKTFEDEGVFDIEHSDNRLKYINEKGKSIIIYLGNSSSAVVEEN